MYLERGIVVLGRPASYPSVWPVTPEVAGSSPVARASRLQTCAWLCHRGKAVRSTVLAPLPCEAWFSLGCRERLRRADPRAERPLASKWKFDITVMHKSDLGAPRRLRLPVGPGAWRGSAGIAPRG